MNAPITYARGYGEHCNKPTVHTVQDFAAFRDLCLADRGTAKGQQWIACAFAIAADDALHRQRFKRVIGKNHRCAACAQPRRWLGMDVDKGLSAESFAALILSLQPYSGFSYTTASSKQQAPRCRVVVEIDTALPRPDLIRATKALRNRIDGAMIAGGYDAPVWDDSCDRPEQPLYLPVTDSESYTMQGEPACAAELLADAPIALTSERHPDVLKLASHHGREISKSALTKDDAIAAFHDLRARGRWQGRTISDGEYLSALAGSVRHFGQREAAQEAYGDGAQNPNTHLANAHRIVKHFGDRLLYVEGIGWHTWQPPWRLDEGGARKMVYPLGRIIAQEAADLAQWVADADDPDERSLRQSAMDARFRWSQQSENAPVLESSLKMAAPLLACEAKELDAKPLLLGLPNGVLELDTGRHRAHQQTDRITKVTGCIFDPAVAAPVWARFVNEIFGGDDDLIDFVQRLVGYTLSGERGEHLLPICYGSGANGKSTLLGALREVFGDYGSGAAPGLLIQRNGNEHPTSLADLHGRRFVVASETGEAGKLNEEQAKLLTGGDAITARRMRQDFYTFTPTHQLFLQTNHRPRVTGTDEGVWRRLRLIPFAVVVPPEKRDTRLGEKLRAELPGILLWALRGWDAYRKCGLTTPAAVHAATSTYRESSDIVGQFIAECCVTDRALTADSGELYAAYGRWCEVSGEYVRSKRDFGVRLGERGYESTRGAGGVRRWRGLALERKDTAMLSDGSDAYRAIRG